jgi:hypothetical protein
MNLNSLEKQILHINQKYDNKIDWGGCGTFSYYLSDTLDRNGIPNQIVYIEEENTSPFAYRCDVKFHHILVQVGDKLIDNHGVRPVNNYQSTKPLDKSKLEWMLSDLKLWNNVFPFEKWPDLATDLMKIKI